MANPYFSFKQFTVFHDRCAMKVGIDGVLLGCWAPIENAHTILDIGTGTGLIALMLAQRSNASIEAIDIEENAVLQAVDNIENSPWPERINVQKVALQEFAASTNKRFDLIVSNPPYFINSTKTHCENRTNARHTDSLTHEELMENAKLLLTPAGRICLILPVNEGLECIDFAQTIGLFCTRHVWVFPKPNVVAKRVLLEFTLQANPTIVSELTIESDVRHQYSPRFSLLAKDFYMKL